MSGVESEAEADDPATTTEATVAPAAQAHASNEDAQQTPAQTGAYEEVKQILASPSFDVESSEGQAVLQEWHAIVRDRDDHSQEKHQNKKVQGPSLAERLVHEIVPERAIHVHAPVTHGSWFKYISYQITDYASGITVRRRYRHFSWLRETLEKQLPWIFLPPMPPKQIWGRFDERFVFKRQKALQRMLNRIRENPHVSTHNAVLHFLTSRSDEEFMEGVAKIDETSRVIQADYKVSRLPEANQPANSMGWGLAKYLHQIGLTTTRHQVQKLDQNQFILSMRLYLAQLKRSLLMLDGTRIKLNEEQSSKNIYTGELGVRFEALRQLEEVASPGLSDSLVGVLSRLHMDMKRLQAWNLEHILLRDESFADLLADYVNYVTEFLRYVKNYEMNEYQPLEAWRRNYVTQRQEKIARTLVGGAAVMSYDQLADRIAADLDRDQVYQQHAKNIDIVFDQFLCECEHFFANRALEMKIMLRSFVVCWKLYAQAVVSTLDENLALLDQLEGGVQLRSASGRPIDVDRLAAASSDDQADSKLTFYAPEDEDIDGIVLNKVNTQAETVPEPRSPQSHTAPQAQVVAAPEHKASRLFTKNSKNAKGSPVASDQNSPTSPPALEPASSTSAPPQSPPPPPPPAPAGGFVRSGSMMAYAVPDSTPPVDPTAASLPAPPWPPKKVTVDATGPSAFDMGDLFTQISGLRSQMGAVKAVENEPDRGDDDDRSSAQTTD